MSCHFIGSHRLLTYDDDSSSSIENSLVFLSTTEKVIVVSKTNMSAIERTFTNSSTMSIQGNATGGPSPANTGGPNPSDEQSEPASAFGIFALDYKK